MEKSFTENLTVSRESILAAYDNADVNGRELLEHLFGAEPFVKNITEQVKTFRDACYVLGDEHPLVKQYNRLILKFKIMARWYITKYDRQEKKVVCVLNLIGENKREAQALADRINNKALSEFGLKRPFSYSITNNRNGLPFESDLSK